MVVALQFNSVVVSGEEDLDTGITDLALAQGPGGPILVSVSQIRGGFVSYALSEGSAPVVQRTKQFETFLFTASGPSLVPFEDGFMATGLASQEVITYDLTADGSFQNPVRGFPGDQDWTHVANINDKKIVLAAGDSNSFSVFDAVTLDLIVTKTDGGTTHARDITDIEVTAIGGKDFLVTASGSENGVTLYEVTSTNAVIRDSIDTTDGVAFMIPTDIEVVSVGDKAFLLVGSAPTSFGAGALTVLELDPSGALVPTDHVLDTLDSRFAQLQSIAAVSYNGVGFVAAGGGDDGISLFAVLDGGRLVHLDALPDSLQAGLDNVSHIEAHVIGSTLHIYVAAQAEAGITTLTVDLSNFGIGVVAGSDGGLTSGSNHDDILADGAGQDTLSGGSGSDVYVLGADGRSDTILTFDPSQDRLDLSGWPQLYEPTAVSVFSTPDGARIEWRGEVLHLRSSDGASLTDAEVRAAIQIDVNRSFFAPEINETGTSGGDRLEGSWGMDVLDGGAGDDTLFGGAGDDTLIGGGGQDSLFGGSGDDIAFLGYRTSELVCVLASDTQVEWTTSDGTETADGVERFAFEDATLTFDELASFFQPQTLTGGAGNHTLIWTTKEARLFGGGGEDVLRSGDFADALFGGDGNDTLEPGMGDDSIDGGAGTDTLRIGVNIDQVLDVSHQDGTTTLTTAEGIDIIQNIESFQFDDGTLTLSDLLSLLGLVTLTGSSGADVIVAVEGASVLMGYAGDDTLEGGLGNDMLDGGDGEDTLRGFQGDDTIYGGLGDDAIWAHSGDDILFGGDGHDALRGGPDQDVIHGEDGDDQLRGQRHNDTLYGGDGNDNIKGGGGNDLHYGNGGNDFIKGGTYHDIIDGGWGDDALSANRGDDSLFGNRGNDVLRGGGNDDYLNGGADDDILFGGSGADTFAFDRGDDADIVADFRLTEDRLNFTEDLTGAVLQAEAVVASYARLTAEGVLFDFGSGDRVLLDGLGSLDGLADAIDIL